MRWIIEGADRSTGVERSVTVEAPDAAQAEQLGRLVGLLVSSLGPAPGALADHSAAPPIDATPVMPADLIHPRPDPSAPARAALPVSYAGRHAEPVSILPDYFALRIGASALRILGIVCFALGLLSLLLTLPILLAGLRFQSSGGPGELLSALGTLAESMVPIGAGILLYTLGGAAQALRDLARNSAHAHEDPAHSIEPPDPKPRP